MAQDEQSAQDRLTSPKESPPRLAMSPFVLYLYFCDFPVAIWNPLGFPPRLRHSCTDAVLGHPGEGFIQTSGVILCKWVGFDEASYGGGK